MPHSVSQSLFIFFIIFPIHVCILLLCLFVSLSVLLLLLPNSLSLCLSLAVVESEEEEEKEAPLSEPLSLFLPSSGIVAFIPPSSPSPLATSTLDAAAAFSSSPPAMALMVYSPLPHGFFFFFFPLSPFISTQPPSLPSLIYVCSVPLASLSTLRRSLSPSPTPFPQFRFPVINFFLFPPLLPQGFLLPQR